MSSTDNRKNVVLVGGGGAGAVAVRTLSDKLDSTKYNLILVTTRAHYVHLVATIRMVVTDEGKLEDTALIPFDSLFVNGKGTLKVGTVASILKAEKDKEGGEVVLESGEKVPYSVLILTPGSTWEGPISFPNTKAETTEWLTKWRNSFEKANDIVFAGGGAVGIEYAGEIKEFWPKKNVTIVQGDKLLLNATYPDKFRKDAERRIRELGVKVVLNDYIDDLTIDGEGKVKTRKGESIKSDLAVPTRGPRPNVSFISSSLGADVLAENGYVKIKPTLQLPSDPRIFAAGDIIDFKEQKQVGKYGGHVAVIVPNVISVLEGQTPSKEYKGPPLEAIFITIGKSRGAGYLDALWGLMFGNWVVPMVKSKGLFISMTRKSLGLAA